jgi:glycosyltransferase involved in cell wall biosynthesis
MVRSGFDKLRRLEMSSRVVFTGETFDASKYDEHRRSELPVLAVICPVFNEQQTIPLFLNRIKPVFADCSARVRPLLCFIDNGSVDTSLELIRSACQQHDNVYVLVLSRNFGYQCALETALRTVEADLYVFIDVDCEDPPEMIVDFLNHWQDGYDIVYGERLDRPESAFLKRMRNVFYRLTRSIADDHFVLDMAEFSLFTAEVRDAIIQDSTSFPFLRASIGRVGFRRKNVPYRRHTRVAGETHYNLMSMTTFAVAGILSSSTFALRIPAYTFPFWLAFMCAVTLSATISPARWQVPVLLCSGFGFLGFVAMATGLYLARVYKNGLMRPNAIIRHKLSVLPDAEPSRTIERGGSVKRVSNA